MSDEQLIWGEHYIDQRTGQPIRYCPLHPGQQAIMDNNARFLFYVSGTGAGKSCLVPIWLESEIRKKPLGHYIIAADSYNRLEQQTLLQWFKHMKYNDLAGQWNQGKHVYTLSSGGKVFFRSLDEPTSIESIHASAIAVDEALILPKAAWDIIEKRVFQQLGRVLVTSTPYKNKRWVQEIIDKAKAGDPNYYVYQAGSIINPSVDHAEVERQRQRLPKWRFDMDYLGLLSMPEGVNR
jgi:hypothetical protein